MLFLLYCHGNWHQHSVLASPRLDVFKDLIVSRKFARLLLSMVLNRFFSPPLYLGVPLELMRKLVKATTSASPLAENMSFCRCQARYQRKRFTRISPGTLSTAQGTIHGSTQLLLWWKLKPESRSFCLCHHCMEAALV